jgi:hypothetical protein
MGRLSVDYVHACGWSGADDDRNHADRSHRRSHILSVLRHLSQRRATQDQHYRHRDLGASVNWHEAWLWLWFFIGALLYMVKRAFYQIKPPNPVATDVGHYLEIAGVPLLFRFALESAFFALLFTPALAAKAFDAIGWENWTWVIQVTTQFAVVAFLAGMAIDPMADWFIPTVIGRIPGLKDWWPQMPGPMPQPMVVQAAIVETKVTALETRTIPQEGTK